jgi:hypothetical protein
MKRQLGLFSTFLFGLMAGSLIPLALAHPESECPKCECPEPPPCPSVDLDGDGFPDNFDLMQQSAEEAAAEEAAIKKALEAIEKAEEDMPQQMQMPVGPLFEE